ncbi:MAG: NADH-quinone oxidoreductase subunit A [Dehalococcoidia bacterium]|jgi:NADH-quinone oxidoreductase subunit A|nr:NADH-quinone oxidoreductase subunit A [Dehalococcoidia bacterium]MDW8009223.1 NADH-quinone oxidoreductase subunit A [Chloroflexota bacterium]
MLSEWGHVGFLLVLAVIFPLGGVVTSWLFSRLRLRPDRPNPVKEDTYECGIPTEGPAWVQFNFRYYVFALLFVIFDVEAVFLFPWATSLERVAVAGFIEVLTFVLVLFIGLIYAWRKRALEWL